MRLILLAFGLSVASYAQKTDLEVKELSAKQVMQIARADADLTKATEALAAAQKVAADAKEAKDKAITQAVASVGATAMEGECRWGGGATYPSPRTFRRVEVRGRYVLITTGAESCSGLIFTPGTSTIGVWSDTTNNGNLANGSLAVH